ncbi:uncharacterized protein LOC130815723 [Amaranthus tricolor]|uniref:uncharacterized protein LOC130815723 n=1 Tax=Amaranthus tricolor TaxID=29722 RepID=UPI002590DD52|nr:uncharacterized protein LOC130815723 [Amaranthus tricolor]XP_057538196.1 uncharacterized protein LOC130815723 [Amaranthus tricolor]XP_057538202.1 uncharacterized protein LOC130815723 [Amaranthus tricolor]XP_057538206.1 uncharacterized protein LOC130815723 [Amaranthus tricolor]XP_057538213.1 uncharacterized protein LOC130815723 [Amaranthus tricolor]
MAGDNPKSSSINKHRPPPSERKSRWESDKKSSGTGTGSGTPINKPSASDSRSLNAKNNTTTRNSSDKPTPTPIPTPKQGLNPSPSSHPNPSFPSPIGPPPPLPPPTYGFHMLDHRTIILADGTVRSYFALPPDYQDFPPPLPQMRHFGPMSLDGFHNRGDSFGSNSMSMKRKFPYGEDRDGDDFARHKQQLLQYGNAGANLGSGTSSPFKRDSMYMRGDASFGTAARDGVGLFHSTSNNSEGIPVDPAIMKACLHFVKLIYENINQRKNYFENGKYGPLQCLACGRSSKDFPDVHALIMHAYNSDNADLRVDHLGLHKALCVIMGWNYLRPPDISKAYQLLPPEEVAANQDDLIMWPPLVIINNTNTGKSKEGRMEGLGNKAMDSKLRDLGFPVGKSKSLFSRDGHLGITLIKFSGDQSGLKEAMRLADHFEKEHHGRKDWAHVQSIASGRDEESDPNLVSVDQRTGEKRRILYGYLATAFDLDKVDYDTRKKATIESKREKLKPSK